MVCALKCLTISFLNWKKKKKKPWFVAFAGFHGVNTLITADFRLLSLVAELGSLSTWPCQPEIVASTCPPLRG